MSKSLADGESVEVAGSGSSRYTLERKGAVYSCTCPAWRNQGAAINRRTCKHLKAYLGEAEEQKRTGTGTGTGSKSSGKAPPLLLAHKWELDQAPDGWWMSEKLDGIRAYWDGRAFWSRLGNRFDAPAFFVEGLPGEPLDGELWLGRKLFQRTTSVVRSVGVAEPWRGLTYVVFDAPSATGEFEARAEHAQATLARHAPRHARWHEHVRCDGLDHLRAELARVEALGGEGLMLRRPGSTYEIGRSSSLLKVKTFHDAEGRVVDHAPGAGKHKGRLGALVVELPGGVRFNVGTGFTDEERADPPPRGAVITFRYQELSDDGVPRFPSYVGRRVDVAVVAPIAKTKAKAKPAATAKPAPAQASGAVPPSLAATPASLRLELVQPGVPGKRWIVEVRGTQLLTFSGTLAGALQTRLAAFDSADAARADAEKRVARKRKEGFR